MGRVTTNKTQLVAGAPIHFALYSHSYKNEFLTKAHKAQNPSTIVNGLCFVVWELLGYSPASGRFVIQNGGGKSTKSTTGCAWFCFMPLPSSKLGAMA